MLHHRDVQCCASRRGGFLLVELVTLLPILAVGFLALVSLSSTAIRGNRIAGQRTTALALAQTKLEELRRLRFADLQSGSDSEALGSDGRPGGMFFRSWRIESFRLGDVPAKDLSVTVAWPESTEVVSVALSTRVVDVPEYAPSFPAVLLRSWRRR